MNQRKRTKNEGFVGLQLTPELLNKLDTKVKKLELTTGSGNRSVVIRAALVEYLKD